MAVHKLIILRHGESQWNHENKFCGWVDVPLSAKGEEEAAHAGELIKRAHFEPTIMYTLKLTRSIQTGNIILEHLKRLWVDTVKTWRLNERHYGAFQGVDKNVVFEKYGREKYQYYRRNYAAVPPLIEGKDQCIDERYETVDISAEDLPKGESLELVMQRLIPYFEKNIIERDLISENKIVLIVTHGSIVRSLIKHLNSVSDADISKINVPTGVPLVFELDDRGKLTKDYYYLDEELARKGIERVSKQGEQ